MKCNFMFVVNKRHHSLKITITFHHRFEFAIWEMVSTRLHEKPWKPHRFWVNLSGRRANWIGFSYLSTSILCTTQIFQVHCTLAQLPTVPNTFIRCLMPRMYIKRNVTWTNKSSCPRGGPSTKKVTQWLKFFEKCITIKLNTRSCNGLTLLRLACKNGHNCIIKMVNKVRRCFLAIISICH